MASSLTRDDGFSCVTTITEEGSSYRCSREKCGGKSVSPRFRLLVAACGDGSSVNMVVFGDVARDFVGKPADVLLDENYGLVSTVSTEISGLTSRSYVVDVMVSRYSFHTIDICFQALKFYPEGTSVFVLVAAGKAVGSLPASLGVAMKQGFGRESAGKEEQANVSVAVADVATLTLPPTLHMETHHKESSGGNVRG